MTDQLRRDGRMRMALLAVLTACLLGAQPMTEAGAAEKAVAVRVAAAADLKFALDEIVRRYRQVRPGVDVSVTFGSSGLFFAQLSNGAPFDLYLSADGTYPRKLMEAGVALPGSEFPYAVGRIVLWVPKESPLHVESSGLKALTSESVKRISIPNPAHAPYGKAAEAALKHYGLYDAVKGKLVMGQNAAQTAQFAQSRSADAAIIPLSLASAPTLARDGRYWIIPLDAHPRLEQAGVLIKASKATLEARLLAEFLTGPDARAVLKQYGFILPGE